MPYEERLSFAEQMQEYEAELRAHDQCRASYDDYAKRGIKINCGLLPRKPVEGEDIYACVPPGYTFDGIRLIAPIRGFSDSDYPLLVWELKDEFRGRIEVRLHSRHRSDRSKNGTIGDFSANPPSQYRCSSIVSGGKRYGMASDA